MFGSLKGIVKNVTLEGNATISADVVAFGVLASASASATVTNVTNRVNVKMAEGAGNIPLPHFFSCPFMC